jgi:hypothetical protein
MDGAREVGKNQAKGQREKKDKEDEKRKGKKKEDQEKKHFQLTKEEFGC